MQNEQLFTMHALQIYTKTTHFVKCFSDFFTIKNSIIITHMNLSTLQQY